MYLKEWAQTTPETLRQKAANLMVHILFGLKQRHELFLYQLYKTYYSGKRITVMDLGSGSGYALSYNNLDIIKYAVDKDNHFENLFAVNGVTFIEHNLETYDMSKLVEITGEYIDLLFLNHVIEHIHHPDKFVMGLNELLSPGGIVYIRTPDISKFKFDFYNDYTHVRPFTKNSLQQLFRTYDFEIISLRNSSSLFFYVQALPMPKIFKDLFRLDKMGRDIELIVRRSTGTLPPK
jgi:2-polyprenyl-3-methyl-5-hydroxy-6-metoxy-1,4-benzoquinol methylase